MPRRNPLLLIAAVVLLLTVLVLVLIAAHNGLLPLGNRTAGQYDSTNLALDVRYTYTPEQLTPAPFDDRAEYPLRLDGTGWSFYGKRIQGLGSMLGKAPGALLYDFVGSQHVEDFERFYGLEPVETPVYEDAQIRGELALHQVLVYRRTDRSRGWPVYFPASVLGEDYAPQPRSIAEARSGKGIGDLLAVDQGRDTAYLEGWAFFANGDLFLFQAVSAKPLTADQRRTCLEVMESLDFDVLIGGSHSPEGTGGEQDDGTGSGTARDGATGGQPEADETPDGDTTTP